MLLTSVICPHRNRAICYIRLLDTDSAVEECYHVANEETSESDERSKICAGPFQEEHADELKSIFVCYLLLDFILFLTLASHF